MKKIYAWGIFFSFCFMGSASALSQTPAGSNFYYVGDTKECSNILYVCDTGYEHFSDSGGCGCKKKTETPKICTQEYAPVCGKTPAKVCMGPGCASEEKTYSNTCMLEAAKATYLYDGQCTEKPVALPEDTMTKHYVGDTESCMMIKYRCDTGWDYFADNIGCGCEKKQGDNMVLPASIKNKLNTLIDDFIKRLEAKNYSYEKNIILIDMVIEKLEKLELQEKYKKIAQYTIQLLEIKKEKYQDDISIIEDILK